MAEKLKLFTVALCYAFAFTTSSALFTPNSSAVAANQTPTPEQKTAGGVAAAEAGANERGLTPQERRGKAIYLRGVSPSGNEMAATVGELDVPASTLTCAGCHGTQGEGKAEGGVTAGNLTWANLVRPDGHTHPTGRKHGPFNETLFARSLVEGLDPSGNELVAAMPRFKMSAADLSDLIAYLKRIESDRDPGITETTIKVGTIVPVKGALAEMGAAMKDVLAAYFADLNGKGGIYNRRIELQSADAGADAAGTAASARRLIEEGQVFAIVGGMSAGADRELAALTREAEIPYVGPSTLLPQAGQHASRYVFYLLPGLSEQARALVNFGAGRQSLAKARVAIVSPESELTAPVTAAIEEQCRKVGCGALQKASYAREKYDAAALVRVVKGADVVFFLGSNGEDLSFIREAAADGWTPNLFLLGIFMTRELPGAVPAVFKDRIFLAFPSAPSDISGAGIAEFRALAEKYKFPVRHTAAQLSALAAAKVLAEGLRRAGRDLSREKLLTALEGFYDYETGLTPRLTFGPNRRVGALGAHIFGIDLEKKEFVGAGGWVKAN